MGAIVPQTTAGLVVERITQVIRDHKLTAGDRLPGKHELGERLSVSRPVLREALARLPSMGLVETCETPQSVTRFNASAWS